MIIQEATTVGQLVKILEKYPEGTILHTMCDNCNCDSVPMKVSINEQLSDNYGYIVLHTNVDYRKKKDLEYLEHYQKTRGGR